MSLRDFCSCTPSEFRAVYNRWFSREEERAQREWEMTRFLATCALQPYSRKPLKPTDIVRFSWEKDTEPPVPKGTSSYERMKEVESRGKPARG